MASKKKDPATNAKFKHSEINSLIAAGLKPYIKDGKVFASVDPSAGFVPVKTKSIKEDVKEIKDKPAK